MKQGREVLVDEEQREAERAALRNVRGLLDRIEAEEEKGRKLQRAVLVAVAVLLALGALYFVQLLGR
jgi:uncharacterized membrane protein YqjE